MCRLWSIYINNIIRLERLKMNLKGAYTWIDPKRNDLQEKNFSLMLGQSFRRVSSIGEAEEIVKRSTNQKFIFIISSVCLDDLSRSRLLD